MKSSPSPNPAAVAYGYSILERVPKDYHRLNCPACLGDRTIDLRIDRKGRLYASCTGCHRQLQRLSIEHLARLVLVSGMLGQVDGGLSGLRAQAAQLIPDGTMPPPYVGVASGRIEVAQP